MPHSRFRRRQKLIQPRLQLGLVGVFAALAFLGMELQFILLGPRLMDAVGSIKDGGSEVAEQIPVILQQTFLLSFCLVFPLIIIVGILATFSIAGPIYRFKVFLAAVARGEQIRPCKLRRGDPLVDLCHIINQATEKPRLQARWRKERAEREPSKNKEKSSQVA